MPSFRRAHDLTALACPRAITCVGLEIQGVILNPLVPFSPGYYTYNGSNWTRTYSTIPQAAQEAGDIDNPSNLTCTGPTDCYFVGYTPVSSTRELTTIFRFNGRKWTRESSTSPGVGRDALLSVSCWRPGHCFAVGDTANSDGLLENTLVLRRG